MRLGDMHYYDISWNNVCEDCCEFRGEVTMIFLTRGRMLNKVSKETRKKFPENMTNIVGGNFQVSQSMINHFLRISREDYPSDDNDNDDNVSDNNDVSEEEEFNDYDEINYQF